ncbi:MAG: OmpH family outer membrane protein, partial [Muribaculaceae bacterium]|nr:OmpH family outer membrane protein [Muribaculaceae bacterium]
MKKLIISLAMVMAVALGAYAQKFALVDMDYILRNVPSYEMANEQLNQVSQRWEREVTELQKEAETMYKNYQAEMIFLTDDQKQSREEELGAKEQ